MATPTWQVSGQYYETCNCDFVCPCLPGVTVSPSKGTCAFAMAFEVSHGTYGTVVARRSGVHRAGLHAGGDGERRLVDRAHRGRAASAEQREAITAIASGAGGGPMAALSGLVGKFLGVQPAPIRFDRTGAKWSVKASDFVDMAAEGAKGLNPDATEPMHPTTRAIRPPIASRWHVPPGAVWMPLVWSGKTSAARTTDSMPRFPGATPSTSSSRRPTAP